MSGGKTNGSGAGRWDDWVGKTRRHADMIDPLRASAMAATLDTTPAAPPVSPKAGGPLPPLWHWAYFWEVAAASALGPDGHAARGDFLPPIDLPRRMWAGSRLRFLRPLPIGVTAERISSIEKVEEKQGRSGALAFVTVRHRVRFGRKDVIDEAHDIVYREASTPASSSSPAAGKTGGASGPGEEAPPATWSQVVQPDPVLLFRYSALTFNGHRIHYDADYAREVEGYPGLIVHGPLLASMMVGLAAREGDGRRIAEFSFRALAPIFDTAEFTVAGRPDPQDRDAAEVWVTGPGGELAMRGQARYAPA